MAYYRRDDSWEDLGDNIQEIIDRALNSGNYHKLNQKITKAVNRAVDTGAEAVRREAARQRRNRVYDVTPSQSNQRPDFSYGPRTYQHYQQQARTYQRPQYRPQTPQKQASNVPALYGSPSGMTAGGILEIIGGSVLAGSTGLSFLAALLIRLSDGIRLLDPVTGMLFVMVAGGTVLLGDGIRRLAKVSRFKEYVRTLGGQTHCELKQLARAVGKPVKFVKKELRKMISQGLFLEGHIDAEETSLITSDETYRHYAETRSRMAEQARQEKLEAEQKAASEVKPEVQEVLDKGNHFIREIRRCNDEIPGEEMTAKIDRMETIIRRIFERAEAHPEIVPDLKKMMDYYLPMTVKLLAAYAEMDKQPIQGDNIQSSKKEIENTLDTLNAAFEKLLDSVFKETAMDVSSDITVLKTLLTQEGLADDEFSRMKKERQEG